MRMDPDAEALVRGALDTAGSLVRSAQNAGDTDAMKEAIRVARNNLITAYETITNAEQAARAKYWTLVA